MKKKASKRGKRGISFSTRAPVLETDIELVKDDRMGSAPLGVPWWAWLLGVGGLATVVIVLVTKGKASTLPLTGNPVLRRDRANGVDQRLQDFLDWWEGYGPFPLTVMIDGGVRTDEAKQAQFFATGVSGAKTLAETPHGRGGAMDLYPTINGEIRGLLYDPDQEEAATYFRQMGALAKEHGLKWGGDWLRRKDLPHVEVPDWKELPFPPRGALVA